MSAGDTTAMTTRRQFIGSLGATGLAAWTAAVPSLGLARTAGASATGLYVVDARLSGVPGASRPAGVPVVTLQGDVSGAWFNAIRPHLLQQGSSAVQGLTQADALFCLQQLAADLRWRLVGCEDLQQGVAVAAADLACSRHAHAWRLVPAARA